MLVQAATRGCASNMLLKQLDERQAVVTQAIEAARDACERSQRAIETAKAVLARSEATLDAMADANRQRQAKASVVAQPAAHRGIAD